MKNLTIFFSFFKEPMKNNAGVRTGQTPFLSKKLAFLSKRVI